MCRSEPIVGTRARDKCAPAVGVSGPVFGEYAGVQFIGRMDNDSASRYRPASGC